MNNHPTTHTTRLPWLDALRGFTMILVVAYHVAQFGFGENEKTSAALPFLVLMRMPLFFFVSGFLACKLHYDWSIGNALSLTWKKLKVQVVPALVFLCLFVVFKSKGSFCDVMLTKMQSPTKGGYWFTWVLLQIFVLYYTCNVVGHYLRRRCALPRVVCSWAWVGVWLLSVVAYETLYMPKLFTYHKAPFFAYSSLVETIRFMQFFLLGHIVRRHWARAQRLFDSTWLFPLLMTLAVVCCADIFRWHTLRFVWTNLPRTTAMYALLLLVVMFFRYYQQWFTGTGRLGTALRFVGQRTLDIYLLHFLLLPKLPEVGAYLNTHQPNFVLSITLSVSVAVLITAFCLLVSQLLRISPIFRLYLFGRR